MAGEWRLVGLSEIMMDQLRLERWITSIAYPIPYTDCLTQRAATQTESHSRSLVCLAKRSGRLRREIIWFAVGFWKYALQPGTE